MTESVVTAAPDATVREIAELMRERNVGSVVLVSDGGPVGFLTDRDLTVSVLATGRSDSDTARDHASTPVITAEPDLSVQDAGELMVRHGVRRLVVVSGDALVGARRSGRPRDKRAGLGVERARHASRAAGLLLPRARRLTTASAKARITGWARVPSPANSG